MSSAIGRISIPSKLTEGKFTTVGQRTVKPTSLVCRASPGAASTRYGRASFRCHVTTRDNGEVLTRRRTGNYKPPLWEFEFIQSLSSEYTEEGHLKRASELVVEVGMMLDEGEEDVLRLLEFIDDLQRLCISHHFQDKIDRILRRIHEPAGYTHLERDLYSTALEFRLLRQHGFRVSQEVFDSFKNESGDFKESLGDDTRGLLQLYEASFLLTEGEKTLEQATEFAAKFLRNKIESDDYLSLLVSDALELPLHWRIPRLNARWFISAYETRPYNTSPVVLELAKLDFNIVQATHQQELKLVSRWWKETGLAEKLPFARDRVVECYLLTVGDLSQPQFGYSRIMGAKVNVLVTIIDDMFDVYGTLEELQLFNNAMQRWDVEEIEKLPDYMQLCYLALNNFVDEMAFHVLKEQGSLIIPHLRKSWSDLCATYLQEATWYSMGYTPTLEQYIETGWTSISVPVMLCHAYFLVTNPIQKEAVESLFERDNIVRFSGTIARLANDLGTSPDEMKRGDVAKSIQCYVNETGAGIDEAREHVKYVIRDTWKKINRERVSSDFRLSGNLVRVAVDFARIGLYVYQDGDGHGIQSPQTKNRISSLLFEPIV